MALTEPAQRAAYGHTLIRVVESLQARVSFMPAVAMVEGRSSLRRRINALANPVVGGRRWSMLLGLLLILVAVATCTKPSTSTTAPDTSDPNTRVYNIGDLYFPSVRDNEVKTDEQGWPVIAPKPVPDPEEARITSELVKLIQDTVDSDSWSKDGNSIAPRDGQLVIKTSLANHQQIERLMAQLRETRGLQIKVEARFLTSDAAVQQLAEILGPDHDFAKNPAVFMTDEQSQTLMRALQKQKDSTTLTAPRITLFNGQRAYVMVASETAYVGDFTEKNGQYEPVVKTAKSGMVFDCQATASADRKYVTVTLRPHLSRLRELSPVPWPKAPEGRNDLMIQIPMMDTVSYSTTVSIPDRSWLVTASAGGPTMGTATNPLVMVRATLIEQQEASATTVPSFQIRHP
jgi:hypothetical protein